MKPTWDTTQSACALVRRFLDGFTPPERMSCSEWAERHRRLSPEASSKSGGAFSFDDAPWQREVLDAPADPEVSHTVLMWASQTTGKTETVNNMIGFAIDIDPCPILVVQYSVDMGKTWSKDRLATMLRDTPRLRGRVREVKSRDGKNTLLQKRFPGGDIAIAGANAAGGLASRPRRKVILDEVDRYPASAGTEGDPVALAEKRTESYPDAEIVMASSPGIEGKSRIKKAFNESDQRYWFVPCQCCGEWQRLKWGQVRCGGFMGFNIPLTADPKTAEYVCEAKGCVWTDEMRRAAVLKGEWRATAPFNGVRGYQMSGLYCLFKPKKPNKSQLEQMVRGYISHRKTGEQKYMVWWNTFLAETWTVEGKRPKAHEIAKRCRTWNGKTLHPRCLLVVGAADVQDDRIEVEFIGYGDGNESWGLGYYVLTGDTDKAETGEGSVWKKLDDLLFSEWDHPCGQKLRVAAFFIDTGHRQNHVYNFTKPREYRNIHGCAGSKIPWTVLCAKPTRTTKRKALKYQVGGDVAKDITYGRLGVQDEGPRYCHFPVGFGYDEKYFGMLTAEKLVIEYDELGLEKKKTWEKQQERNEALDIRCYALAALESLNPQWHILAKKLAIPEPEKPKPADGDKPDESPVTKSVENSSKLVDQPVTRPPFRGARGNWRGGFRGGWR